MLYITCTLNFHNVTCQLYLYKAGGGGRRKFKTSWTKIKYKLGIIPLPSQQFHSPETTTFIVWCTFQAFSLCLFIWPYTFMELVLFLHK